MRTSHHRAQSSSIRCCSIAWISKVISGPQLMRKTSHNTTQQNTTPHHIRVHLCDRININMDGSERVGAGKYHTAKSSLLPWQADSSANRKLWWLLISTIQFNSISIGSVSLCWKLLLAHNKFNSIQFITYHIHFSLLCWAPQHDIALRCSDHFNLI